jgi:hypothetical protein
MLNKTLSRRVNKKPKKTIPKATRVMMTTTKMTITTTKTTMTTKSMMMAAMVRKKKLRKRKKSSSISENAHTLATCTKKRRIRLTL